MTFLYDSGVTDPDVRARCNIAKIVIARYREAVTWQGSERLGEHSLRQVLRNCYDQSNGIMDPGDREVAELLNANAYVNLTAMKTGVAQAFLVESLTPPDALPWVLEPTPLPELSESGVEETVALVKGRLFGEGFQGDLGRLAEDAAREVYLKEQDRAKRAARLMERKIFDQTVEGSWREALSGFIHNFVTYPYGIMHGPFPVRAPRLTWNGERVRPRSEVFYRWESVSPWDFWYSPDSPDTQRGTGVCLRKRYTRRHLLEMGKVRSYLRENVRDLLLETEGRPQYNFKWMSQNPDELNDQLVHWVRCGETIDALVHHGFFSGRELQEYGVRGLDAGDFYNASVTVIGGYTVQVHVPPPNTVLHRPVFTASFYRSRDRIPSRGIAQVLRDTERAYLAALRYLLRNMANAAEPLIEADVSRISKHMNDRDVANFTPGKVYLVESDPLAPSVPAIRPFLIPSNIGDYVRVMEFFMEMAERVTNIPAALHGTAVGTGANRTFRGMATLQSNAIKSLQDAVGNIDEGVFLPMGQLLYNYNLLYEKDPAIKGDCKVHAQGVAGLLQKEINRNNAMDILQVVGAVGAQMGLSAGPVVDWAVQQVLHSLGVPQEIAGQVRFGGGQGAPQDAGPSSPPSAAPAPPPAAGPPAATPLPPEIMAMMAAGAPPPGPVPPGVPRPPEAAGPPQGSVPPGVPLPPEALGIPQGLVPPGVPLPPEALGLPPGVPVPPSAMLLGSAPPY
jgi:hypothetical protein